MTRHGAAAGRWPLYGRDRELGELGDALDGAGEGRGRLLLLVGEPGIGKSRLAEVFAEMAAERGATVAWGRAWEAGGAPAYWPWIEVLRDLDLDRIDLPASALAVAAHILPELRDRRPDLPAPPPLEPAQATFRLFDAIASLLRRAARESPLVIVLDDLHAADVGTLSLLHFAARGLRHARVLLVGSYREVEARMSAEVADALARVAREGRYLPLARLDRDEVASWVRACGIDPELGALLYQRSEGNPLFVIELLRLLGEKRGSAALAAAIPLGVRDVLRQRLERLPGEARALLDLASVLGRHADVDLMSRAAGASPGQVRARLAPALAAELVADGGAALAFSHVLVRDVLYAQVPAARRAELHRLVAEVLLARHEDDPDAPLAELVHHLFAASPDQGDDRSIAWARRAAAQAASRLAFEDAVGFLDRALAALAPERDAERFELELELAAALFGAGQVKRGREICVQAAALARRLGEPERLARAALAYGDVYVFASVDATLIGLLQESLAALADVDSPLRARLLGRLAAAQQPAPDPQVPMAIAREAIAMARRVAEPATHLSVLQAGISALLYFGDPAERIPLGREFLELAARLGDRARVWLAHLRLAVDYLESGDAARADASIDTLEHLAREIGLPRFLWQAAAARSMRRMMQGDFAASEALAARARELADQIEDPERHLCFALHRLGFLRAASRHDELSRFTAESSDLLLRVLDEPYARACIAGMWARVGRPAEARAALAGLADDLSWASGRFQLVWLGEVAAASQDTALAAAVEPMLAPLGARNHAWGVGCKVCEGPVARVRGTVAALLGRFDQAERHFEDALVRVDALGARPHRARVELEYAGALARRGREPDRERARRLLESAVATADQLAMPGIAEAAAALAGDLAPARRAPPALPAAPPFALTCEGEYWSIACGDAVFRLRDSRGLQILARLVSAPDREFHVTDLLAPAGAQGLVEDSGEALDARARDDYRERLAALRDELVQAEEWNDHGRAERVREEIDFLAAELARGIGLGGRARRAGSTSEKARINVRRRLLDTVEKIAEHSPALGQHLSWALKTGNFCVYRGSLPPARRRT